MAETPSPAFKTFMRATLADDSRPLNILEVGGGSATYVRPPQARYTVLEASSDALEINGYANERLVGDAELFDYDGRRFDIVVFWNVLEHLRDPLGALDRACATLPENGLLVVRGPELRSLKSMIARATPHALHVWFYRRVLKNPNAGLPGHSPFPVEHAVGAGVQQLHRAITGLGFDLAFKDNYVGDQLQLLAGYSPIAYRIYKAISWMLRKLTGSQLGKRHTDFVRVYRRVRT